MKQTVLVVVEQLHTAVAVEVVPQLGIVVQLAESLQRHWAEHLETVVQPADQTGSRTVVDTAVDTVALEQTGLVEVFAELGKFELRQFVESLLVESLVVDLKSDLEPALAVGLE